MRELMPIHQVTEREADEVVELFALAFYDDPTWSWAFRDPSERLHQLRTMWSLSVHSAIPYGWVWKAEDGGAAALWVPPGCDELSTEDEERLQRLIDELPSQHAAEVRTLMAGFEAHHPREEAHYYLSLLATHPDHRGLGKGMSLLRANLERIDELGMPAYLESSNRANDRRYQQLGFVQIGQLAAPGDGPTVASMWRARCSTFESAQLRAE